jgi:4-aminobutyrate aminotransferase/(S)-3-amino-2-methylpropionate transaminase
MTTESTNAALQEARNSNMAKGLVSATDCYIAKAEGALLFDIEGREYIDFGGALR